MELYDQNVDRFDLPHQINSIEDAEQLHKFFVQLEVKLSLGDPYCMPHYRGEQKFGWDILPNIFRIQQLSSDVKKARQLEKQGWQEFESVIKSNFGNDALRNLFDNEKHGVDWNLFMQAQHAGIKTSLVDWSPEVYAPLFFATEQSQSEDIEQSDAQFWIYMVPSAKIKAHIDYPQRDTYYDQDPQSLPEGSMINVSIYLDDLEKRNYETRMYHQKGRFYISEDANCNVPMNKQPEIVSRLFRFIIPAGSKATIRKELVERGIDRSYLFGNENPAH